MILINYPLKFLVSGFYKSSSNMDGLSRFQQPWRLRAPTVGCSSWISWKRPRSQSPRAIWYDATSVCIVAFIYIRQIQCPSFIVQYMIYIYIHIYVCYNICSVKCVSVVGRGQLKSWISGSRPGGFCGFGVPNVSGHGVRIAELEQLEQAAQIQLSAAGW